MILSPREFRGRYRTPGTPRIDWNHPLTNGLIRLWLLDGAGAPNDLVTGAPSVATGHVTPAASHAGGAGYFGAQTVNTNYYTVAQGPILGGTASWSIAAGAVLQNGLGFGVNGASIYAERAASGNDILAMGIGAGGAVGKIGFTYRNDAGTLINSFGATDLRDTKFHVYVNTKNGSGSTNCHAYVDGVDAVDATWNTNDNFTNAGLACVIGATLGDGSNCWPDRISFVALYNRSLSAREAATLSADPFGHLVFPDDEILARLVASRGNLLLSSAF